jgi:hypothetical protein
VILLIPVFVRCAVSISCHLSVDSVLTNKKLLLLLLLLLLLFLFVFKFKQGIYNYVPQTNCISGVQSVAAVLL